MSTGALARIFLSPPHMSGHELAYIHEAFASNYVAPTGPMLREFEREFADYSGIPHAVALSSGTAALHLALKSLDLTDGDEVWASTLTFIGSVVPVMYERLAPVFFDADRDTWTISPSLLAEEFRLAAKRGKLPKALIPTDLYGQSCDLDAILAVTREYGVPVVCDSAEAVGAHYKGRHAGDGAFATIFSFNGNKIITTSGGGMLASGDKRVIDRARYLSTQARQPAVHYEHTEVGYNYRLSNISAAIGRGQLEILEDRVARRRAIFDLYQKLLGDLPGLSFMPEAEYGRATRWLTVILLDDRIFGVNRVEVQRRLESQNIESRPVWKPMHLQPVFEQARHVGGAVAEELFQQGLCLPSGSQMTDQDVERVASIVRAAQRVNKSTFGA
jgi:dTDP-4-amino-4,6-dideoxygalactose transaminase